MMTGLLRRDKLDMMYAIDFGGLRLSALRHNI